MKPKFALCLSLLVLLATTAAAHAQWTSVGDGIEYQQFTIPPPDQNNIFVARLQRSNTNAYIESSIGQGRLSGGTETVRSQAARYDEAISYWGQSWGNRNDVVVAINGSYYDTGTGVPFGGVIHSGWYAKRYGDYGASGFVWQLDRDAYLGLCVHHRSWKQFVTYTASGATQEFQGINRFRNPNELIIYTPQYDSDTGTSSSGAEVLVEMTLPALILPTPAKAKGYVREIRDGQGSTQIPFDHVVLSATDSQRTTLLNNVTIGAEIGISQEITSLDDSCSSSFPLDWTKSYAAVGGNWEFLQDGVIYNKDPSGARHPRTAIAYNDDYVFYVICDGRDPGVSIGMTIAELADFCKNTLGATWGVNQDGGGSSTMVINGAVMNNPSDGSERPVSNGIMMCNILPMEQSTTFAPDDTVQTKYNSNVRLGPGTNYAVLATMPTGTQGTILDHSLKGVLAKTYNWWKVDFSGTVGWIAGSLLEIVEPPCDADLDGDGDVDGGDFITFSLCYNGALRPPQSGCATLDADLDADSDVDGDDFLTFSLCYNGSLRPPQSGCACYSGS